MYYTRSLATFLLFLTPCLAVSAQQRKITIKHFKDEPVEIVSVRLNGVTIQPDTPFESFPGWASALAITVRNESDSPVTYVFVHMMAMEKTATGGRAVTNSNFETPEKTTIQPDETMILQHKGSFGSLDTSLEITISITAVHFADDSIRWSGGRYTRKTVMPNKEIRYYPMDRPTAPCEGEW